MDFTYFVPPDHTTVLPYVQSLNDANEWYNNFVPCTLTFSPHYDAANATYTNLASDPITIA